jgi:hypothetical protein
MLTSLALGFSNRLDWKSPSSVSATGFLPRVLSFLFALSHLERITHRPNNLFFQLQSPLSPRESAVQTGQQATHSPTLRGHNNQWGENRHGLSNRLNNVRMVSQLWLWDKDSTHKLNLFRQRMSRLSRNQHRLSPKSTQAIPSWFYNCMRSLAEVEWVHAQAVQG